MRRARLAGELVARGICFFQFEQTVIFFSSHSLDCSCLPLGIRLGGGRPIRGRGRRFVVAFRSAGEGKIFPDVAKVSIGNQGGLAQPAFPLAVLALQQVACSLFTTKDLPRTCHFETLGNGFPCLCFSRDSWHGTGNLGIRGLKAREKW